MTPDGWFLKKILNQIFNIFRVAKLQSSNSLILPESREPPVTGTF
jgi:hypothetical protein